MARTAYGFNCGDKHIAIVDTYVYIGLLLDELQNYNVTAKFVSQAASSKQRYRFTNCQIQVFGWNASSCINKVVGFNGMASYILCYSYMGYTQMF